MINRQDCCYLFKSNAKTQARIYHRVFPDNTVTGDARWNTPIKEEAGYLSKDKWEKRSLKWEFKEGWILESMTGEKEFLGC